MQADTSPRNDKQRTMCLIATAKAACDDRLRAAVQALQDQGHTLDVRVTWDGPDANRFASEAAEAGYDTVIAAGGDGTLNCVVNGVIAANRDCAVGVVPLGTANDFATACGISMEPSGAFNLIINSVARRIDLGKLNDRVFVNVASGGSGTGATVDVAPEAKDILGSISYAIPGLRDIVNFQPHHATISGPDFVWEGAFYAIAVGNCRQAGGGFQVCPRALLDDGLLDLMIVPDVPRAQVLRLLGSSRNGELADQPEVVYAQLPWFEMQTNEPLQINLDGEPRTDDSLRCQVLADAVRVYLPPSAPLRDTRIEP